MDRAAPLVLACAAALLALAGCGNRDDAPEPVAPRDPVVAAALDDPLMTDPDLSSRNEAAAALTVDGPGDLPVLPATPEAIAAARAEALKLVGGKMMAAPQPNGSAPALAPGIEAHALALAGTACRAKLTETAMWAAKLPPAAPIYPAGATETATGSDERACQVRAVAYRTPVSPSDVAEFYWTLAVRNRLAPQIAGDDDGRTIRAQRGRFTIDVRIAPAPGGGALVRLATLER